MPRARMTEAMRRKKEEEDRLILMRGKEKVRLLDKKEDMTSGRCPRCSSISGFRKVGGKRPGLECMHCGIFFPSETWVRNGETLKKKYAKKKRSASYVDSAALAMRGTNIVHMTMDEVHILADSFGPDILEM